MMWSITDVVLDIYHILVLFIHLVILVKYYELLILRKVCSFEGLLLVSSLPSPGMLGQLFYFVAELIIERSRDILAAWLLWVALLSRVCNTIQLLNIILLSFINILKCICAHACADGQYTYFEAIFKCRFSLNPCQDGIIGDFPLCLLFWLKILPYQFKKNILLLEFSLNCDFDLIIVRS